MFWNSYSNHAINIVIVVSFRVTAVEPIQKMSHDSYLFPPPPASVPMSIHHWGNNTFCYIIWKSHCKQLQRRLSHEFRDKIINAPFCIWWLDFTFLCILFRTPNKLQRTTNWMTSYLFPSSGFPPPPFFPLPSHKTPTRFKLACWGTSPCFTGQMFMTRSVWHTHSSSGVLSTVHME